ncbi:hypothetical protein SLEP1_g55913 [Rubroshorea leprosula]|uniref:Uncharacterized protein n=1 Tax=Rubroshorea leprosula TaxID=152421 RepID=A0AAV5MKN7_9ROSI|nr:hypothetical protein SLEP1_g55913 [Rubroshorea leprosula]
MGGLVFFEETSRKSGIGRKMTFKAKVLKASTSKKM